ncbi:MAG: hypothetical protein PHN31_03970 [Candidatus Gracilibacteria bacterium]|nr:hypothetical protein [Candidatus Gracilibacteria bacterium]
MYKKIYINLDNLEKEGEIFKFHFLFDEKNIFRIWDYSMKMGETYDGRVFDLATFELFLFFNYLKKKGYKKENIEVLSDTELFIKNDDLYKIENGNVYKLETKNVGFFSTRGINWNNPFFFILSKIIEKKGGVMKKTNNKNSFVYGKGKFYALNSLYNERKNYIGDIIIPYNIKKDNYDNFINYIKSSFSSKIVIKKDFSCAGQGVYVIDLDRDDSINKEKFVNGLTNTELHYKGIYITPYYNFEDEYRFYFTKYGGKIKLFSFKRKQILSSFEEIVNSSTFQYYKNVKLKWEYVKNSDWNNYKDVIKLAKKYLDKLEYSTGTLEFGKTVDGKYIFFEVNPMSATLCYRGEDEKNLNDYYLSIFDNFLL